MRDVVESIDRGLGRLSEAVALRLDLVEVTLAPDFLLSHAGSRLEKRCMTSVRLSRAACSLVFCSSLRESQKRELRRAGSERGSV